jgi:hypothetical protein
MLDNQRFVGVFSFEKRQIEEWQYKVHDLTLCKGILNTKIQNDHKDIYIYSILLMIIYITFTIH